MSAFIVGEDQIDLLVTFATEGAPHDRGLRYAFNGQLVVIEPSEAQHLGEMLLTENVRSVNHRYNETTPVPLYTFRRVSHIGGKGALITDVLNAARCLEYQSCDHPEWATSQAKAALDGIVTKAVDRLIPDDSPWCWTRDHQREAFTR